MIVLLRGAVWSVGNNLVCGSLLVRSVTVKTRMGQVYRAAPLVYRNNSQRPLNPFGHRLQRGCKGRVN